MSATPAFVIDPSLLAGFVSGHATLAEVVHLPRARLVELRRTAHGLLKNDQLERAIAVLRGLVVLDPFDGWAHSALGVAFLRSDMKEEAEVHLRRALVINPLAQDTRLSLAELLLSTRARKAEGVAELKRVVALGNGKPSAWVTRAGLLLAAHGR